MSVTICLLLLSALQLVVRVNGAMNGEVCTGHGSCDDSPMSCQDDYVGRHCCADAAACENNNCGTCLGDGSCVNGCSATDGCFDGGCTQTIDDCVNVVSGWIGAECHRYSAAGDARCLPSSTSSTPQCAAATDTAFCAENSAGTAPTTKLQECASAGCRITTACVTGTATTTSDDFAEVCYTSGQQGCLANERCNSLGACSTTFDDGEDCTMDTECASTNCVAGKCCATSCGDCETCATGTWDSCVNTCTATETSGAVCDNSDCPVKVSCAGRTLDIGSGTECRKYAADTAGPRCLPAAMGTCAAATDYAACLDDATVLHESCGSVGCVKPGVCGPFEDAASIISTKSDLCHLNSGADNHGCLASEYCDGTGSCVARDNGDICDAAVDCPSGYSCNPFTASAESECCADSLSCGECQTCATGSQCTNICSSTTGCDNTNCPSAVACTDLVKGWNGNNCEAYTSDRPAACGNGAEGCISTPTVDYCSPATVSTVASCGSTECQRMNVCTPLANKDSFDTVSELCFDSLTPLEGACTVANGYAGDWVCDSTGTCVARADGETCTNGPDCASGNCVDGTCCSASSCPDCQNCSTGSCANDCSVATGCLTMDAGCSVLPCNQRASGWSGTACEFFSGSTRRCKNDGTCAGTTEWGQCDPTTITSQPQYTCGHLDCVNTGACSLGDDLSGLSLSDLCHEDGRTCGSMGGQCGTGGKCLSPLGGTCAADDDCVNNRCRQGRCCSSECVDGCGTCDATGTCQACSGGACDASMCTAVTIACANKIAGWNGASCEKYVDDGPMVQQCKAGVCATATDDEFCSGARVDAIGDGMGPCADVNCIIEAGCVVNTFAPVARSAVCDASGTSNANCMAPNVCRGGPAGFEYLCAMQLSSNGDSCMDGSTCSSSICSASGHCCDVPCGPCGTCESGTCVAHCSDANGCAPMFGGTCPSIQCSNRIKGFDGSGNCLGYTADRNGLCEQGPGIQCAAATDYSFCDSPGEPATTTLATCGSTSCQRASVCQLGDLSSTVSSVTDICFADGTTQCEGDVNKACSTGTATCQAQNGQDCTMASDCLSGNCVQVAESPDVFKCCDTACTGQCSDCISGTCTDCSTGPAGGCPTTFNSRSCSSLACDNKVAGWNGNTCERFTADTLAKCTSSNVCATNEWDYCTSSRAAIPSATCAHPDCRKACPLGGVVGMHNSVDEVCHTDGTSQTCGGSNDQHCTAGGECKKDNAQTCGGDTDCISNQCGGVPARCCSVPCGDGCFQCNSGTSCQPTCSNPAGCTATPANACPTTIACNDRVAGWAGRHCEWFQADAAGRCSNGGGCVSSTDYSYCDSAQGGPSHRLSCGDPQCAITDGSACQRGDPFPTMITAICHTSGRQGCAPNEQCDSTGSCKLNYGETCSASSECAAGAQCSRGRCCASACGACEECDASGVCQPTCSDPNGCVPSMGDCSGTLSCSGILAGWNSNVCEKYNSNPPRLCRPTKAISDPDLCTPPSATSFCASPNHASAPTKVASAQCDSGCVDSSKCTPLAAETTGDFPFKICHTSGQNGCASGGFCTTSGTCNFPGGLCTNDMECSGATPYCQGPMGASKFCCSSDMCDHPCQDCSDMGSCAFRCTDPNGCAEPACTTQISCNNRAKGWNGRSCERFTANEAGKCQTGGLCTAANDRSYCRGAGTEATACINVECRIPSACALGDAAPTTPSDVCYEDGLQRNCPAGNVCSVDGECKLDLGQPCSSGNQCHSTHCQQGVCCEKACGAAAGVQGAGDLKECMKCNLPSQEGLCRPDTNTDCGGTNDALRTECSDRLAGWANSVDCMRYTDDVAGICTVMGNCNPNVQNRCETEGAGKAVEVSCGDAACVDPAQCIRYTAVTASPTVADVCKTNVAEAGCPSIRCNDFMAGWNGRTCEIYGPSQVTGQCTSTGSCSPTGTSTALNAYCPSTNRAQAYQCGNSQCRRSDRCQVDVALGSQGVSSGCHVSVDRAQCTDIVCTTTVKGWNGRNCERYNSNHPGFCTATGSCSSSTNLCKNASPALTATLIAGSGANRGQCPTASCIDPTACVEGDNANNNDSRLKVCLVDAPAEPCPDITCNNRVAGINQKTCERFVSDTTGHCDNLSECITSCDQVPGQTRQSIAVCGSVECMRPGACQANDNINLWNSVSKLCFVNDEDANCATGAKCDSTGTCKFVDTGGTCTIDDNCVSKFCWKDPTKPSNEPGICCSEACKDDCQECGSTAGICQSRTGEACALPPYAAQRTPLQCPNFVKGWGTGSEARTCLKYGLTRTRECNAAAQCRGDAALCEADSSTGSQAHLLSCANSQCKRSCTPLAPITTVQQNDICFTDSVRSQCPDIMCTDYVSGWNGRTCRKWQRDHEGYCESTATIMGRCSTQVARCASQAGQGEVTHRQCGSQECRRDGACQTNTLVSAQNSLGAVCRLNAAVTRCPNIACSVLVKGWNQNTCEKYDQDHPGYCTGTGTCDTSNNRCETNTGLGADGTGARATFSCLASACRRTDQCQRFDAEPSALADVCRIDVETPGCPDIPCSETVAGWNGKVCEIYDNDYAGWCLADTSCDTDRGRCDNPEARAQTPPVLPIKLTECASDACRRTSECQPLSLRATSNTIPKVCHVNTDISGCGQPHSFDCNQYVTGWGTGDNAKVCQKYSATSAGHCNAQGGCITQCSEIPQQIEQTHLACGDVGCVRADACQVGQEADTAYPDISSICYTDKTQHGCQDGATCNAAGACTFADDGLPCTRDIECGSGHCWKKPGSSVTDFGICCNQACSNECQECESSQGTCQPRTDATCSLDVPCDTFLRGFSAAAPNKCQRYSMARKGVCTAAGVCGTDERVLCTGLAGVDIQVCQAAQCSKTCERFEDVSTANTLGKVCYVNVERSECVDIDCPSFLAGWNSNDGTVCDKYKEKHPGFCDSESACASSPEQCANVDIVPRESHVQCGEAQCIKAGGCEPGAPVLRFATLADVCIVDTPTAACATLACTDRVRGWKGRTCEKYAIDSPGFCNSEARCETSPEACASRAISGVEHVRCGSRTCTKQCAAGEAVANLGEDDVCIKSATQEDCPDIMCTLFVKGWDGRRCMRYESNNPGYCDEFSACSTDVDNCAAPSLDIPGVPIPQAECGSVECTRKDGCQPGSPIVGFADQLAGVCQVSVDNPDCPALDCTRRLAGWNANVCTRYTRDTGGYCDAKGTCLSECTLVPVQDRVENVRCGSVGCVKKDACVEGQQTITANAVSDVCYTDRQQHDCPTGAQCDFKGACVFPDGDKLGDNSLCSGATECASGFCVQSDEGMNICCNTACSGECEQCVSGKCEPKVGASCGDGKCKVCDEAGQCQAKTTLCGETDISGTPLFACNDPKSDSSVGTQCLSGVCRDCIQPPVVPPAYNKTTIVVPRPDCIEDLDCGENLSQGRCLAGNCECGEGWDGKYCTDFVCAVDPAVAAIGAKACNEDNNGGKCVSANTCSCNSGFSEPNCEADCSAVNNCAAADGSNKNGFCVTDGVCQCNPGFSGTDCQTVGDAGRPCADVSECDTAALCYKEEGEAMGYCCATSCDGECSTCAGVSMANAELLGLDVSANKTVDGKFGVGFCHPRLNERCGDENTPCRVCQAKENGNGGECQKHSSLCEAQGGLPGDLFGCDANAYCFDGNCNACSGTVECGSSGTFNLDFLSINVLLPFKVCVDTTPVTIKVGAADGCLVAWMPGQGVGVDCTNPDLLLTAGTNEKLTINFDPPLKRKIALKFREFVADLDQGRVTVHHKPGSGVLEDDANTRRKRQTNNSTASNATTTTGAAAMTTTAAMGTQAPMMMAEEQITSLEINTPEFELPPFDDISMLEFVALADRFQLEAIESTGFVTPPTTTAAPTTEAPPTTTTTTPPPTTPEPVAPEPEEPSVWQKFADGLAGENDVFLGIFIGVVVFLVLCIIGCIVVGVQVVKKRRADKKLYDAYGEGKPMQSFETVTAKPSTALGEDSDDDAPFGIISSPSTASAPSMAMGTLGTEADAPRVGIKVEPLTDSSESE